MAIEACRHAVCTEGNGGSTRTYYSTLVLLAVALAWLLGPDAFIVRAQDDDPLHAIGIPSLSGQIPVPNGFINVVTGNLHMEFLLVSLPQRGRPPFKVVLAYDSNIWYQNWCCFTFNASNIGTNYPGAVGWRLYASTDWYPLGNYTDYGYCTKDGLPHYTVYNQFGWVFPDGTVRYFPISTVEGWQTMCGDWSYKDQPNGDALAIDGSGYHMYVTGFSSQNLYAPDGTRVGTLGSDANGNYFDDGGYLSLKLNNPSLTDTLGRNPVLMTANGMTTTLTVPNSGTNGGTSAYVITFAPVSYDSSFPVHYGNYSGTFTEIQSLQLPDGTRYSFNYDSGTTLGYYGLLTSVTLPTGATISYSYSNFPDSEYYNGDLHVTRMISTMTTPDGQWTFTPAVVTQCTSNIQFNCQQQLTVTKPAYNGRNDNVVYKSILNGGGWPIEADYYTGGISSSNLVATITQSFDLSHPCSYGGPYYICSDNHAMQVTKLATTITLPTPSGTNINQTTQFCHDINYGNLLYKWEWNFYTGAIVHDPNPPANCSVYSGYTPNQTTTYTYLNGSYLAKDIDSKLASVTVTDSGGNIVAKTLNSYDGPALITAGATGITHHDDTNYGSANTVRGNLTQVQRLVSGTSNYVTKSMTYDITGQIRTETDWSNGNAKTYSYADNFFMDSGDSSSPSPYTPSAPTNAYQTTIASPLIGGSSLVTSFGYYWGTGQEALVTAPNTQKTTHHYYDPLNRPTSTKLPDGGWTYAVYTSANQTDVGVGISSAALSINCNPSGCRHDQVGLDGLGRVSSKTLVSDPDGATTVNTNYDSNGRVLKISNPYRSTSDSTYGWVTTAYDGLDRAQQITEQDGSVEATYYGAAVSAGGGQASQLCSGYGLGYPMLSVDEAGKKRQTWVDGFDRTIEADEPDSNNNLTVGTCYSYDLNNNLTQVVQGSETRTYSYDALSRLTTATNPESGTTNFYYTTSGGSLCSGNPVAVCQRTDARGITTTYLYDVLNRLTGKSYSDTTPAVSIAYDQTSLWGNTLTNPIGRKTSQSTAAPNYNAEIFGYDPMGRVTLNSKCSPANCGIGRYTLNYTYNFAGDLTSATDGVGVTLSYSYDAADRVTAVTSSLVDSQHPATLATVDPSVGYLPNGAVRAMTLGNGLTETGAFQSRLQPCRINVNSSGTFLASCSDAVPSGNVQDFGYGFNSGSTDNGNVASWSGTGTRSFSRTYTYDSLNRLATMSSPSDPSGCTGLSWTYDRWGNRTAQAVTGGSCGSWSAGYNSSNQITDTRFVYDAAGNLTNDGSHSYTYDAENRVTQVDGGSTATYVYDAEGRRVETTVAGAWTDYVRDLSGNVVTEANAGGPTRGYAYFGDRLLTQYQAPTATYFAFTDHLGSTRLLTTYSTTQSQNQQVYDSMDYLPFGEQIAGDSGTTHKFTGYERDPESNNDYAMARYYGSRLGRFMSPDPLGADVSNPQTLNRYAYVRNNPTTLTDPSGLCIVDSEDGFCTDWGFGIGYNPSRGCGGDAGPCKLGGLADNNGGVGNIPSPFGFRYSGCPFGEKSCTTQTFETWEAYANWSMWFASLPPNEAYVQFRKALPYVSATIDPNTVYTIQGQRRGLTTNYQIQSPDAASAVPLDIGMASANGAFDIGGGHGGNSSWYIGGWLNVLHVVDVSNAYLTGQLVGAEFHSDAFSPYGPFGPLHAIDWLASLISRGAWQEFHCSVVEGCQ